MTTDSCDAFFDAAFGIPPFPYQRRLLARAHFGLSVFVPAQTYECDVVEKGGQLA
ncbi:MAG: hypothetical protein L0338_21070 [Acidobacteria bacterium]|nr:hypothetical protein [Acidobacteriota bacterium]